MSGFQVFVDLAALFLALLGIVALVVGAGATCAISSDLRWIKNELQRKARGP